MKKIVLSAVVAVLGLSLLGVPCTMASDYAGNEDDDSVFQKLSDLISGKYEIEGKPLKKIGIFQCAADQMQEIEPAKDLKK